MIADGRSTDICANTAQGKPTITIATALPLSNDMLALIKRSELNSKHRNTPGPTRYNFNPPRDSNRNGTFIVYAAQTNGQTPTAAKNMQVPDAMDPGERVGRTS